ncbi:hypothetical protein DY218_32660 [Streptomyces triticagri]|uniref:Glutaredoxin domain-containing protein n=2 Tax=Streptomyces triticagri TaxID=2293568 RepID=A0A372LV51_9ACTN|nr:hypothetical protein DY218_32660 [Streptomyces triticagri]
MLPMLLALSGVGIAVALFARGDGGTAVSLLVLFLVLAVFNSPLIFPGSVDAAEARRRSADDGRPVVYWRPGCTYCLRLRIRLGRKAGRLHWVNIWRDPDGAAEVRAANDGNETVPTVVVEGEPHTNPDPAWVRDQLPASR